MKQIPNIFTLLNLVFGCAAIVCILQSNLLLTISEDDKQYFILPAEYRPENMYWAPLFIALAAVIDFLDGFTARLLKGSSDIGKQLDSLADVVSFGVAPGMIIYQFLRISLASQLNGLDVNIMWLLPAFIIPCAGAYRLARFNCDTSQSQGFKGVPIPAVGLFIASFPLIYWYCELSWVVQLLVNKWVLLSVVAAISYLMVSSLPMLALKFSGVTLQKLLPFILLSLIAVCSAVLLHWIAVPITFVAYILLSLLFAKKPSLNKV